MESTYTDIGLSQEFPEGTKLVQIGDKPVCVLRRGESWYAFDDYCPHRAGPLSEGTFSASTVTCPWHHGEFDFLTGAAIRGPTRHSLVTRKVKIQDGHVLVEQLKTV